MIRRLGPIYDLDDGLRLQDLDASCRQCYKRLAEVIHDPSGQWNTQDVVCIDCGTTATLPTEEKPRQPVVLRRSWRSAGLRVACCTLCPHTSMPLPMDRAAQWAVKHLAERHTGAA
jgi:hypothetical protein